MNTYIWLHNSIILITFTYILEYLVSLTDSLLTFSLDFLSLISQWVANNQKLLHDVQLVIRILILFHLDYASRKSYCEIFESQQFHNNIITSVDKNLYITIIQYHKQQHYMIAILHVPYIATQCIVLYICLLNIYIFCMYQYMSVLYMFNNTVY